MLHLTVAGLYEGLGVTAPLFVFKDARDPLNTTSAGEAPKCPGAEIVAGTI